jgi:hypothetical protein
MGYAMTGDDTKKEPEDDIAAGDATEENIVLDTAVEGFADTIVAANVDALVAKIDETDSEEAARMRKVRKRLEELSEQESVDLDSTFNFNINEKL